MPSIIAANFSIGIPRLADFSLGPFACNNFFVNLSDQYFWFHMGKTSSMVFGPGNIFYFQWLVFFWFKIFSQLRSFLTWILVRVFFSVCYYGCVFLAVGLFSLLLSFFVWLKNLAALWHDDKHNCVIEASIDASIEVISDEWWVISD